MDHRMYIRSGYTQQITWPTNSNMKKTVGELQAAWKREKQDVWQIVVTGTKIPLSAFAAEKGSFYLHASTELCERQHHSVGALGYM